MFRVNFGLLLVTCKIEESNSSHVFLCLREPNLKPSMTPRRILVAFLARIPVLLHGLYNIHHRLHGGTFERFRVAVSHFHGEIARNHADRLMPLKWNGVIVLTSTRSQLLQLAPVAMDAHHAGCDSLMRMKRVVTCFISSLLHCETSVSGREVATQPRHTGKDEFHHQFDK